MTIWTLSLLGGAMIAAIAAVRTLLGPRMPARLTVALWMAAMARLLIPFQIPLGITAATPMDGGAPLQGMATQAQALPETIDAWQAYGANFADWMTDGIRPIGQAMVRLDARMADVLPGAVDVAGAADAATMADITGLTAMLPWPVLVWAAGAIAVAAVLLALWIRWRLRLRDAIPLPALDIMQMALLPRRARVLVSGRIPAPMTRGILRPCVYVPRGLWGQTLSYAMVHEGMHIRSLDTARKGLALLTLCVHWFNPLVWLMVWLHGRDLEMACDARVVAALGPNLRASYARSLVAMAVGSPVGGFGCGFSGKPIRERVVHMMHRRSKPILAGVLGCCLLAMCTLTFTGADAKGENPFDRLVGENRIQISPMQNVDAAPYRTVDFQRVAIAGDERMLDAVLDYRGLTMLRPTRIPDGFTLEACYVYYPGDTTDPMLREGEPEVHPVEDGSEWQSWAVPGTLFEDSRRFMLCYANAAGERFDVSLLVHDAERANEWFMPHLGGRTLQEAWANGLIPLTSWDARTEGTYARAYAATADDIERLKTDSPPICSYEVTSRSLTAQTLVQILSEMH